MSDDPTGPGPGLPLGPPALEPGIADLAAAIAALSERLGSRLESLESRFDRELRAESTREKVVDRLHAELQEYKRGLLDQVLRPVFIDLIQLHDDLGKVAAAPIDAARLAELLQSARQGVEDVLYRHGVEPFELESEAFDPARQRAISTVPTDDPARARTVAARLRKGFQAGDRVLRPELVSVYTLQP